MQLSDDGLEMIKRFEGFRSHTYLDAGGLPTIGYGHRLLNPAMFPNGVSEQDAASILRADVHEAEQVVERHVKVPLTQGQFDALVDFVFNLGVARFQRSTLLHALNGGRYQAAGEQLLRWDLVKGEENLGLRARRLAELKLWSASTPQRMVMSAVDAQSAAQTAAQAKIEAKAQARIDLKAAAAIRTETRKGPASVAPDSLPSDVRHVA
jgi:lysozyme